jgi:L-serine/L-threonine ammonia-lyase
MVEKLKVRGADVVQIGAHWSEADSYLREELLGRDRDGVYVPPFDHPDIWVGNGTLVEELEEQMRDEGGYDAVVCSVGGGGLFSGIMGGLEKHGRLEGRGGKRVKVMAMETSGADSLSQSLKKGELVKLPAITSIATSLGAAQVCRKAFEWGQREDVTSCVFADAEAGMGSVCFADDERILVEAACGVSVAPAYNGTLREILFPELGEEEFETLNVVIVVCGGSNITLQMLEGYRTKYAKDGMVLRKFHRRKLDVEGNEAEGKAEKEKGIPNIMHNRLQHEAIADSECVEKVPKMPAIAMVEK